jgi:prepilin-type N-terminal cleavage/methylation domain-containing protein/prepilin-type processing-associated H-X9-DG protein
MVPRKLALARRGFTLIELLVVIAIIAILIAFLIPAVQRVRESSNRLDCTVKLKNIGLALHNYAGEYGAFPPAHVQTGGTSFPRPEPPDDKQYFSWMCRILPYVEQGDLYNQVNWTAWAWWQHPINETELAIYKCTSDYRPSYVAAFGSDEVALTAYMGVSGTDQFAFDGMLYINSRVTWKMITDGSSNTLLVGERPPSTDLVYGWWFAGAGQSPPYYGATDVVLGTNELTNPGGGSARDVYRDGQIDDPGNVNRWHFWSLHHGGSNFLFADGSVHFLSYDVGQPTFQALGTRNGEEAVKIVLD